MKIKVLFVVALLTSSLSATENSKYPFPTKEEVNKTILKTHELVVADKNASDNNKYVGGE
jgi:hypothetical protein